eukprot:m.392672 g.392672  ORF g.392672 m.392672 type:complete len:70 (+) comp21080_c1_seq3:394-603(+)
MGFQITVMGFQITDTLDPFFTGLGLVDGVRTVQGTFSMHSFAIPPSLAIFFNRADLEQQNHITKDSHDI